MTVQRTLVLVKPDGVRRRLVGEIVRRFEAKGFDLVAMRMLTVDDELAKRHYEEHVAKPFFPELLSFITSGPTIAMAIEGDDAVPVVRQMIGTTNPKDAAPGTAGAAGRRARCSRGGGSSGGPPMRRRC